MTWKKISKKSDKSRKAIESVLMNQYKAERKEGKLIFKTKTGEPFTLFTFSEPEVAVGIEYAEEDGDLYYPVDYTDAEEMARSMMEEIEAEESRKNC